VDEDSSRLLGSASAYGACFFRGLRGRLFAAIFRSAPSARRYRTGSAGERMSGKVMYTSLRDVDYASSDIVLSRLRSLFAQCNLEGSFRGGLHEWYGSYSSLSVAAYVFFRSSLA
jgi:hypothetical protein